MNTIEYRVNTWASDQDADVTFQQWLNAYGADGWELIDVDTKLVSGEHDTVKVRTCVFKRPIDTYDPTGEIDVPYAQMLEYAAVEARQSQHSVFIQDVGEDSETRYIYHESEPSPPWQGVVITPAGNVHKKKVEV